MRIWGDGPSRQLLGNFDEHSKRVTGVCVDLAKPNLIHSCADDKLLVTIDLNQARRTGCHSVKEGQLRSMVQCSTGELELITGDTAGALKWWDCDEVEPIAQMVTLDSTTSTRSVGSPRSAFASSRTAPSAGLPARLDRLGRPAGLGPRALRPRLRRRRYSEEITQCAWAPDGKQVVSVGKDACICVWNFYGQAKPPGAARVPPRR